MKARGKRDKIRGKDWIQFRDRFVLEGRPTRALALSRFKKTWLICVWTRIKGIFANKKKSEYQKVVF